ncbi:MAG: DUF4266 domain-containing protein [Bacteroidota bacterium]
MKKRLFNLFLFLALGLSSCVGLKSWERIYVDDPDMQMDSDAGQRFTHYVHSIREGATPAGMEKSGGGCGCN